MNNVLSFVNRDSLTALCQRHGIARLSVFGSAVRGDFGPDSDVDILVEFIPGRPIGLRFITIQRELEELIGRKVDLNTRGFLNSHFRDRVEAEAVPLYEAA